MPWRRRLLRALLWGGLVWILVWLAVRLPPGPAEPLPLRWGRKLAEHPFRGVLALACAAMACFRPHASGSLEDRDRLDGPSG